MNCASSFSQCCGLLSSVMTHPNPKSARSEIRDLEALTQPLLKLLPVSAAKCKPSPVLEHHHIFPVEPGLHFLDAVGVDDARAVNADETLGIEPGFHVVHGLPEEVRVLAQMQPHVV